MHPMHADFALTLFSVRTASFGVISHCQPVALANCKLPPGCVLVTKSQWVSPMSLSSVATDCVHITHCTVQLDWFEYKLQQCVVFWKYLPGMPWVEKNVWGHLWKIVLLVDTRQLASGKSVLNTPNTNFVSNGIPLVSLTLGNIIAIKFKVAEVWLEDLRVRHLDVGC